VLTETIYDTADRYVLHCNRVAPPIVFERALGARLWDVEGKEYLDLLSSNMGPAMVGHSNPRVVRAIEEQARQLISTSILFDNVPLIRLCEKMAEITPANLDKTYICPGGGEANEGAIKLAMLLTGRSRVVSLTGAYHGQSMGMMWLCGLPSLRERTPEPFRSANQLQVISGDAYRPWPTETVPGWQASLDELEATARETGDIAAVIIEPLQAVAGHVAFEPDYYRRVNEICRSNGILLIADEIQTALGRCGALWASELVGLEPDMITTGKAFGAGLPYGAISVRSDLIDDAAELAPWHMVSAQGNPIQAAVALEVIDIVESEHLVERSNELGRRATARFAELADRFEVIGDIRGPGLFIGVDLVADRAAKTPATAACAVVWPEALERGLIVAFAGPGANVFKFKPPLTLSEDEFERMLAGAEWAIGRVDELVRQGVS
jgi:4-aminobutyrate aminotransferase-like enzyme